MPVAERTVDDLIKYLEQYKGERVFPNNATVYGMAGTGKRYLVLSNIQAFWYPEGNISIEAKD